MTNTPDEFLTVREAAELVGVTAAAVYNRIDARRLTRKITLGVVTVPRIEVETWREERQSGARKILSGGS